MKLKDHPMFPKEKSNEYIACPPNQDWLNGRDVGYNQALRELGELEILEPLDKGNVSKYMIRKVKGKTATEETHFGTKKVSVEEIEKIIFDNSQVWDEKDRHKIAIAIAEYINKGG